MDIGAQYLIPNTQYLFLPLAIFLRLIPWLANYPLHPDEALYGYWAQLISSGRDPALLTPWIDKPPLALYAQAFSLKLLGVSELALRLPGLLASVATVGLVYALARRAYGARLAALAGILCAASPFAILFAPTAFTDPWLTLWLVAAAWAAWGRRGFWAGLCLGLAVASKQQGVLGVPLIVGLLVLGDRQIANGKLQTRQRLFAICNLQFAALLGFALILAPLTYWDSLRWSNRPSFWERSLTTYGGLALAAPAQWLERAAAWAGQLGALWGVPLFSAVMLALAAVALLRQKSDGQPVMLSSPTHGGGMRPRKKLPCVMLSGYTTQGQLRRTISEASRSAARLFAGVVPLTALSRQPAQSDRREFPGSGVCEASPPWYKRFFVANTAPQNDKDGSAGLAAILGLFIAAYLALHVVVTFQPWDRYLLPIVPFVCILAARGMATLWGHCPARALRPVAAVVLAGALIYATWLGVAAGIPVGSDHGLYGGIDQVAARLREQPAGTVVYQRWLGWHYDFYLFGAPLERRWWRDADKLADDAAQTAQTEPARGQWLALPAWEPAATESVQARLAAQGLALIEMAVIQRPDGSRSFTLYRITTRGAP